VCTSKEIICQGNLFYINLDINLYCVSQDSAFSPMIFTVLARLPVASVLLRVKSLVWSICAAFACAFFRAPIRPLNRFLCDMRHSIDLNLEFVTVLALLAGVPACFGRSSSIRTLILHGFVCGLPSHHPLHVYPFRTRTPDLSWSCSRAVPGFYRIQGAMNS